MVGFSASMFKKQFMPVFVPNNYADSVSILMPSLSPPPSLSSLLSSSVGPWGTPLTPFSPPSLLSSVRPWGIVLLTSAPPPPSRLFFLPPLLYPFSLPLFNEFALFVLCLNHNITSLTIHRLLTLFIMGSLINIGALSEVICRAAGVLFISKRQLINFKSNLFRITAFPKTFPCFQSLKSLSLLLNGSSLTTAGAILFKGSQ